MPEYTRPATWEDLKRLARLLNEAHAEYALVGGYAIASHGFSRQSEDIDLLVNPAPENSRRWIVALTHLPDRATEPSSTSQTCLPTTSGTRFGSKPQHRE